ncbi:MAG: dihydrofolate reductase [bacterium]
MIIISAMTKERLIGNGNGMPWNVPEEFRQFQDFIAGQTVIMGSRSYEIFKDHLTSKHNLVISRSRHQLAGATVCGSIEEAVEQAQLFGQTIFCAGGAAIYELFLPFAQYMYLSFIKGNYSGDTYFPAWKKGEWVATQRADHPQYEFVIYKRKQVSQ